MMLSTENISFMLQNNPEHVIVSIIINIRRLEQIMAADNEDKIRIKSELWEVSNEVKEFKFNLWYLSQPWYKKFYWKAIKRMNNDNIKNRFYHERV